MNNNQNNNNNNKNNKERTGLIIGTVISVILGIIIAFSVLITYESNALTFIFFLGIVFIGVLTIYLSTID